MFSMCIQCMNMIHVFQLLLQMYYRSIKGNESELFLAHILCMTCRPKQATKLNWPSYGLVYRGSLVWTSVARLPAASFVTFKNQRGKSDSKSLSSFVFYSNEKQNNATQRFTYVSAYVCVENQTPFVCFHTNIYKLAALSSIILTWYRADRDPPGGLPRKRPFHCTSVGLKPAITPNVGNSGTQFICVGVCVRANPWLKYKCNLYLISSQSVVRKINQQMVALRIQKSKMRARVTATSCDYCVAHDGFGVGHSNESGGTVP